MVASYTTNMRLQKPGTADRNWDIPINANADLLDGMTAIGAMVVTTAENPSTTRTVRVAPGYYRRGEGTIGTFAGTSGLTVVASSTTYLWLTDAGVLTTGAAFPTTAHVRLASVVSGADSISGVIDQRVQCASSGDGLGPILKGGDTIPDGAGFAIGAVSGVQIGTAANQKIGFFGSPPATQAAAAAPLSDATGATAGSSIANMGSSYNEAAINANFAALTAKVNALIAALKRHGLMAS